MDNRGWTKELTTELIALYRDNPCLWKVKDKRYLNKNLRNAAYDKLVTSCKTAFPEANRDFVAKKIQSLRGSFRKELKKVKTQQKSGSSTEEGQYTPSLWYYDLLLFTADSDNAAGSIDNIEEEAENQDSGNNKSTTEEDSPTLESTHQTETDAPPSVSSQPQQLQNQKSTTDSVFYEPPSKRKKNRSGVEDAQMQFMLRCSKALEATSTDVNEFEAIGIVVKKKLERMDPEQAASGKSNSYCFKKRASKAALGEYKCV